MKPPIPRLRRFGYAVQIPLVAAVTKGCFLLGILTMTKNDIIRMVSVVASVAALSMFPVRAQICEDPSDPSCIHELPSPEADCGAAPCPPSGPPLYVEDPHGDNNVSCNVQVASGANQDLCVSYSSTNDGSDVTLLPCSSNLSQNWNVRISPDSGIWFEAGAQQGKVLEVSNWSQDPRGRVQIWGLNIPAYRSSQMWNVIPTVLRAAVPGSFFCKHVKRAQSLVS
jgi:hypothetical protein